MFSSTLKNAPAYYDAGVVVGNFYVIDSIGPWRIVSSIWKLFLSIRWINWLNQSHSGANPTFTSYNASVVNFYNAAGSLARFENKNIIF
jgi:hypothetical protein